MVGHELTHGFDDQGSQFDGYGNLKNWWTPDDKKKFDEMTDCEVKEYGNFTAVDDVKVNGKLTLGENTADNGGIRLAYSAFLDDAKRKGIDLDAKQDGFDAIQQFFIGFAQNWCSIDRPQMIRLQVQTDPHSPECISRHRSGAEYAGVRQGLRLQNGPADDAHECMSRVVACGCGGEPDQKARIRHPGLKAVCSRAFSGG